MMKHEQIEKKLIKEGGLQEKQALEFFEKYSKCVRFERLNNAPSVQWLSEFLSHDYERFLSAIITGYVEDFALTNIFIRLRDYEKLRFCSALAQGRIKNFSLKHFFPNDYPDIIDSLQRAT